MQNLEFFENESAIQEFSDSWKPSHNGVILWQGASQLDGSPIVLIATGFKRKSGNGKTGSMIQTFIIRSDMHPLDAINDGSDKAICGDCIHRGIVEMVETKFGKITYKNKLRSCYVNVGQSVSAVFRAFINGSYPVANANDLPEIGKGRKVRLGTYGDPAAVPFFVWEQLLRFVLGNTGYSHQWRHFPELAKYCMASVDSLDERLHAKILGFRCFRVSTTAGEKAKGEQICPASDESAAAKSGKKLTCQDCMACSGHSGKARCDMVIFIHGPAAKVKAGKERIAA